MDRSGASILLWAGSLFVAIALTIGVLGFSGQLEHSATPPQPVETVIASTIDRPAPWTLDQADAANKAGVATCFSLVPAGAELSNDVLIIFTQGGWAIVLTRDDVWPQTFALDLQSLVCVDNTTGRVRYFNHAGIDGMKSEDEGMKIYGRVPTPRPEAIY